MIAYLRGDVLEKGNDFIILLVEDVGYKITVPGSVMADSSKGSKIGLFTHESVRDDGRDFFGFKKFNELVFFWKLISVSGIGARTGLNLLSLGPVESIQRAVDKGDVVFISSAKGVGKKTAQRIVLELKGRLVDEDGESGEVVSALENLGYPRTKALMAASSVPQDGSTEERIKMELRMLSR